jgi:polyhydroxybutyrate depolymerase
MRAMIVALAANSCIDARRVYVAGRSDGGGLAQLLACEAADVVAAVLSQDFDLLTESVADCKPVRPIAVLAIRSAADAQLPYDGGEIRPLNGLNAKIHALGAVDSLQRWAALSQCGGTPQSRDPECQFHSGCGAAVEVGLCTRAGKRTAAADAAAGWEFLSRFSLP